MDWIFGERLVILYAIPVGVAMRLTASVVILLSAGSVPLADDRPTEQDNLRKAWQNLFAHVRRECPNYRGQRLVDVKLPFDYWSVAQEYRESSNDRQIYCLVGSHIHVARRLLASEDNRVRTSGLGLTNQMMLVASTRLDDAHFAAGIADLLLLPNLESAATPPEHHLSEINLLGRALAIYSAGGRARRMEQVARRLIELSERPNAADAYRLQLAKALRRQGWYDEAVGCLDAIRDPSMLGAKVLIDEIRDQKKNELGAP